MEEIVSLTSVPYTLGTFKFLSFENVNQTEEIYGTPYCLGTN